MLAVPTTITSWYFDSHDPLCVWPSLDSSVFWTRALYSNCVGQPMQNPCKAHTTPTLYPRDTDSINIVWVWHGPTWVWHGLDRAVTVQCPRPKPLESNEGQLHSAHAVHVGWTALGLRSTHKGSSTGYRNINTNITGKEKRSQCTGRQRGRRRERCGKWWLRNWCWVQWWQRSMGWGTRRLQSITSSTTKWWSLTHIWTKRNTKNEIVKLKDIMQIDLYKAGISSYSGSIIRNFAQPCHIVSQKETWNPTLVHTSPNEVHICFIQFSRWPQVTDPDPR